MFHCVAYNVLQSICRNNIIILDSYFPYVISCEEWNSISQQHVEPMLTGSLM